MKNYDIMLQVLKGFLGGALGFWLFRDQSSFLFPFSLLPYVIIGYIDNIVNRFESESVTTRTALSWSMRWRNTTLEQFFFHLYSTVGLLISAFVFRSYIPSGFQLFFLMASVLIPINSIGEYRRLKEKEQP